jgi:DNA-binding NtrC family response regulator
MLAMPFERRSSAGRDLMERSSMGHQRWQTNLRQLRQRAARAAALISESIGIPPHLSLPPFDARSRIYRTTNNRRRKGDDEAHDRDT